MKTMTLAAAALSAGLAFGDVSLNGNWKLDYFPQPDDGAVRTLPVPGDMGLKTVQATVPGNCELDLVRAGVLPEPEIGLNIRKFRDYEGHQWLYTKTFVAPKLAKGERAMLRFAGVDTLADYFLNGEKIGESANMLIEHAFDVTKKLRDGENTLQVLLRSVLCEAQHQTVGELGFSMAGGADGEPFRKAGHMGGWDIFPRAFVSGLWRDVTLAVEKPVRIDQTAFLVKSLTKDRVDMIAHCRVQAPFRYIGKADVTCRLIRNGKVATLTRRRLNTYQNCIWCGFNKPDLWWPKGMGEPALYDATIEVVTDAGEVLASHTEKIGIRTIKLEREDWYGPDRPGQFLFRVNGEPCYVRGSNWVPLDSIHSRDHEFMKSTLDMFDDLNCNMVRVWGGGVYEPDEFFDYCDAHGIMVWQDFMTGCSVFPQTDEYAKETEKEIRSIVLKYRNRASLALWSGNNENDGAFCWHVGRNLSRDPNKDRNSRVTIPNVLYDLDLTRDYLPSSPYYSPDVSAGKAKPSEEHLWGARAYYKVPYYTNSVCHFASEMGYHGCPNRESLEKMMTKGNAYPWTKVTGKDPWKDYHWNEEWQFKASDPWLNGFGFRRNSLMTNQAKLMFGDVPTDFDDFVWASQLIQAEAMKTFVERFRSEKFTKKNGLIWWNVRDGWPQISDAVVDYYGGKKRAYYAIKAVQHNQLVVVRDDHDVVAVNDTLKPVKGTVKITDKATGKVVFEKTYDVPANKAVKLGEVAFAGQGLLTIDYEQGGEKLKNWFLYGDIPFKFADVKGWFE